MIPATSSFAIGAFVYGWLEKPTVLWLTLLLYAIGLSYYVIFARGRLISAAPGGAGGPAPGSSENRGFRGNSALRFR